MADGTGSVGGAAGDGGAQSFAPSALRAGVKLQTGEAVKISVIGLSGRPLRSGREPGAFSSIYPQPVGGGSGDEDASGDGPAIAGDAGDSGADPDADHHVVSAEVRGDDGQLLVGHGVKVWSSTTNQVVGQGTTDENGVLRVDVPSEDDYRLELIDTPLNLDSGHGSETDDIFQLRMIFTDGSGAPLVNETITVDTDDGSTFEMVTDETGLAATSGPLGAYNLTVRGQKFTAHSLPAADHETDDNVSRFTVGDSAEAA